MKDSSTSALFEEEIQVDFAGIRPSDNSADLSVHQRQVCQSL